MALSPEAKVAIDEYLDSKINRLATFIGIANVVALVGILWSANSTASSAARAMAEQVAKDKTDAYGKLDERIAKVFADTITRQKELDDLAKVTAQFDGIKQRLAVAEASLVAIESQVSRIKQVVPESADDPRMRLLAQLADAVNNNNADLKAVIALAADSKVALLRKHMEVYMSGYNGESLVVFEFPNIHAETYISSGDNITIADPDGRLFAAQESRPHPKSPPETLSNTKTAAKPQ